METKKCFKCGRELPLTEFYKHPRMCDGHLNKCKDCAKKDVRENYLTKSQSEAYMEKERARGRDKYRRLYAGTKTEAKAKKEKLYRGLRSARQQFHVSLSRDIELHHWNYNVTTSVFKLEKRLHKRLHKSISLNLDEGIYYHGDIKLDSIEKHWEVINTVCDEYGFDKAKVELLTR